MFAWSKNRACDRERVKEITGRGNGGSIVVNVGTNNADKEGTTAILEKYRDPVFCPGFQKGRVPSEKGTLAR